MWKICDSSLLFRLCLTKCVQSVEQNVFKIYSKCTLNVLEKRQNRELICGDGIFCVYL